MCLRLIALQKLTHVPLAIAFIIVILIIRFARVRVVQPADADEQTELETFVMTIQSMASTP